MDDLPARVEHLEQLGPIAQKYYRQSNEGSHFVPIDISKTVQDLKDAKTTIEAKDSRIAELEAKLDAAGDFDPDLVRSLLEKREQIEAAEIKTDADLEQYKKTIKKTADERVADAEAARDEAIYQLETQSVESELDTYIAGRLEDDTPQARRMIKRELSSYIAFDPKKGPGEEGRFKISDPITKEPLYNDAGEDMTVRDLVNAAGKWYPGSFRPVDIGDGGDEGGVQINYGGGGDRHTTMSSLDTTHIRDMTEKQRAMLSKKLGPVAYQKRLRREREERASAEGGPRPGQRLLG